MAAQEIHCNSCGKKLNNTGPVYYCGECAAYYCMNCGVPESGTTTGATCPNCTAEMQMANM